MDLDPFSPAVCIQHVALDDSFNFSDLTFHLSEMVKSLLPATLCCLEASMGGIECMDVSEQGQSGTPWHVLGSTFHGGRRALLHKHP